MRIRNPFPFGDQVTITSRTQTGVDDYGQPVYDDTQTVVRGVFSPSDTVRDAQTGSFQIVERPNVLLPYGTQIDTTSTVAVGDVTYYVDGVPQSWKSPFSGWKAGMKVALTTARG